MKKLPILSLLLLFFTASLPAADMDLRVPPQDLNFQPANNKDILSLLSPAENSVEAARWNNIIIRLPEAVPYRENLVIQGTAHVTSGIAPSHLAFTVKGNHQKGGYTRVRFVNGSVDFHIALSKLEPDTKSANKESLNAADEILEIRVFASFPDSTNSTLTLNSLVLTTVE